MADARRKLEAGDLMGLEKYARERDAFRASVIAHKQARTVAVGPNMTWPTSTVTLGERLTCSARRAAAEEMPRLPSLP